MIKEPPFEAVLVTESSSLEPSLSSNVGYGDGDVVGISEDVGDIVGDDDGTSVVVGPILGDCEGWIDGGAVGATDGNVVGRTVGVELVGIELGDSVGMAVGAVMLQPQNDISENRK